MYQIRLFRNWPSDRVRGYSEWQRRSLILPTRSTYDIHLTANIIIFTILVPTNCDSFSLSHSSALVHSRLLCCPSIYIIKSNKWITMYEYYHHYCTYILIIPSPMESNSEKCSSTWPLESVSIYRAAICIAPESFEIGELIDRLTQIMVQIIILFWKKNSVVIGIVNVQI